MFKRFTLLILIALSALTTRAYDFSAVNSDGVTIYYTIINEEAYVDASPADSLYTGVINIPSMVTNVAIWEEDDFMFVDTVDYPVVGIRYWAFYNCSGITAVTIPNSVTSIGSSAFRNCTNLTSVTLPAHLTTLSHYAFAGCSSLTTMSIPNTVVTFGEGVFSGCSNLTSVNIPNSATALMDYVFNMCSSLSSVNIPEGVTSIGNYAFYGCSALTSITLPHNISSIGPWAFLYCSALDTIIVQSQTPPSVFDNSFNNYNVTICVPCGSQSAYQVASVWCNFSNIQEQCNNPLIQIYASADDSTMGYVSGSGAYQLGDTVTLTAVANEGYRFVRWSNGSGSNPLVFTVENSLALTAHFEEDFDCNPIALPWNEGFESENALQCWAMVDADGDGYNWMLASSSIGGYAPSYAHTGNDFVASNSYNNNVGALLPENWLISPEIVIPDSGATLSWWVAPLDGDYNEEHYKVMLSSSAGTTPSDFNENLFEETINFNGWMQRSVTIQNPGTVRIAFVHYNCSDQFMLAIDDISAVAYHPIVEPIRDTFTVVCQVNDAEMGSVSGAGRYADGDMAIVTATANEGYAFDSWNDGSTDNPRYVTVSQDTTFVANFRDASHVFIEAICGEHGRIVGIDYYTSSTRDICGETDTVANGTILYVVRVIPDEDYCIDTIWQDGEVYFANDPTELETGSTDLWLMRISSNHTVRATFREIPPVQVSYICGTGGTIKRNRNFVCGETETLRAGAISYEFVPEADYMVDSIFLNGEVWEVNEDIYDTYYYRMSLSDSINEIRATFRREQKTTVNLVCGEGGYISKDYLTSICGQTDSVRIFDLHWYQFRPDENYMIDSIIVNDELYFYNSNSNPVYGGRSKYIDIEDTSVTIRATFREVVLIPVHVSCGNGGCVVRYNYQTGEYDSICGLTIQEPINYQLYYSFRPDERYVFDSIIINGELYRYNDPEDLLTGNQGLWYNTQEDSLDIRVTFRQPPISAVNFVCDGHGGIYTGDDNIGMHNVCGTSHIEMMGASKNYFLSSDRGYMVDSVYQNGTPIDFEDEYPWQEAAVRFDTEQVEVRVVHKRVPQAAVAIECSAGGKVYDYFDYMLNPDPTALNGTIDSAAIGYDKYYTFTMDYGYTLDSVFYNGEFWGYNEDDLLLPEGLDFFVNEDCNTLRVTFRLAETEEYPMVSYECGPNGSIVIGEENVCGTSRSPLADGRWMKLIPDHGYAVDSLLGSYDGETYYPMPYEEREGIGYALIMPDDYASPVVRATFKSTGASFGFSVVASSNDQEKGNVSGAGLYEEGDTVTLTATPNMCNRFVAWSNGSTDNPLVFTCSQDVTLTAFFASSSYRDTLRAEACDGYLWNDTLRTASGIYRNLNTTVEGCDSSYVLILSVYPSYHDTMRAVIFADQQLDFAGETLSIPGTYTRSMQSQHGCDSTLTLNLFVYGADTCFYSVFDTTTVTHDVFDTTFVTHNVFDTTFVTHDVFDTTYTNITLYDTITTNVTLYDTITTHLTVFDTLVTQVFDTTFVTHDVFDTTYTNITLYDTLITQVFDTTYIEIPLHDTVIVTEFIHDTVYIEVYIHDTLYLIDTLFIHDTIYLDPNGVEEVPLGEDFRIGTDRSTIILYGAPNRQVRLLDALGRQLLAERNMADVKHYRVPATGVYYLQVDGLPARKVVVLE